uniref:Uncharacterized protein n=1 Tax=Rhizophora mucronata TaxID=61149 RepID=A0A2P2PPI5_RHIMU
MQSFSLCGGFLLAVGDEFNTKHQSSSSHISNDFIFFHECS